MDNLGHRGSCRNQAGTHRRSLQFGNLWVHAKRGQRLDKPTSSLGKLPSDDSFPQSYPQGFSIGICGLDCLF